MSLLVHIFLIHFLNSLRSTLAHWIVIKMLYSMVLNITNKHCIIFCRHDANKKLLLKVFQVKDRKRAVSITFLFCWFLLRWLWAFWNQSMHDARWFCYTHTPSTVKVKFQSFPLFGSFYIWSTSTFFFFCQSICLHRLLIDCITCTSHSILPLRHCEKLQKVCWKNHLTFIQLNRTSLPLALIFLAGEEWKWELNFGALRCNKWQ